MVAYENKANDAEYETYGYKEDDSGNVILYPYSQYKTVANDQKKEYVRNGYVKNAELCGGQHLVVF